MPLIKQILTLTMRSRDASQKQVLEFNILPVHSHNPKVTNTNVPEKATKPRIHIRNDGIDTHDCSLLNSNKLKVGGASFHDDGGFLEISKGLGHSLGTYVRLAHLSLEMCRSIPPPILLLLPLRLHWDSHLEVSPRLFYSGLKGIHLTLASFNTERLRIQMKACSVFPYSTKCRGDTADLTCRFEANDLCHDEGLFGVSLVTVMIRIEIFFDVVGNIRNIFAEFARPSGGKN
ncbi:hypothetical protein Tco_0790391 [Tanacetum coccineum]